MQRLEGGDRVCEPLCLDERGGRTWRGECATDPAVIKEVTRTRVE
jgi:hypothetical protein